MANLTPGKYRAAPLGATHPASGLPIYGTRCGEELDAPPNNKHVGTLIGSHESGVPIYGVRPCAKFYEGKHGAELLGTHEGSPLYFDGCNPCAEEPVQCVCPASLGTPQIFLHVPGGFLPVVGGCEHVEYLPHYWILALGGGAVRTWTAAVDYLDQPPIDLGPINYCSRYPYSMSMRLLAIQRPIGLDYYELELSANDFFGRTVLARWRHDPEVPDPGCVLIRRFQQRVEVPERVYFQGDCGVVQRGCRNITRPRLNCSLANISGCEELDGLVIPLPFRIHETVANSGFWLGQLRLGTRYALASLRCASYGDSPADYKFNLSLVTDGGPGLANPDALSRQLPRLVFATCSPFMLVYECDLNAISPQGCTGRVRATITL